MGAGKIYKAKSKKTKKVAKQEIVSIVKAVNLNYSRNNPKVFRPATTSGITVPTAGGTYMLSNIVCNTQPNDNTRIGADIRIVGMSCRGEISCPTSSTTANLNDIARLMWFVDHQTNGVQTTVAALLTNATGSGVFSHYNEDNQPVGKGMRKRFTILQDKYHAVSASAAGWNGANFVSGTVRKPYRFDKKLNTIVRYNGLTGAISEQNMNSLGCCMIGLQGVMYISINVEIYFVDAG